uniref:Metalloendopeptidase n=1 Tax=Strigamia maritima TaxID=126957 RepID=T1IT98_STRMM
MSVPTKLWLPIMLIIVGCNSDDEKLFQGDMVLSAEQYELFYGDSPITSRKGHSMKSMLWPDGIVPYKITTSSHKQKKEIETAMKAWADVTCLHFREIPVDDEYNDPHLLFVRKQGCSSDVGRKYWQNGQEVIIGFGCENPYKIAHEIGHAIGFHHEQARKDRDDYIKIITENFDSKKMANFKKQTYINNFNIPYDYDSIMHYSMYAFSDNDKKTIAPHDPTKQFLLGQRDHLSFYDVKLANVMYSCDSKCDSKLECQNEGYVDSSCTCTCKPGYGGKTCEKEEPTLKPCGGYVTTSGSSITSPNYPQYYTSDQKCVWWIKAPEGKKVDATFTRFDIFRRETDGKKLCYFDKLEIRTKDVYQGEEYCGEELNGKSIQSESNSLVLIFESGTLGIEKGFDVKVKFV